MIKMKRIVSLALVVTILFSCKADQSELLVLEGSAIGTTYSIKYLDSESRSVELEVDALITAFNRSMSTYLPESDISKINRGDTAVIVDRHFVEVFEKSARIYKETEGAFDPTVGVLVNAWGFGPDPIVELPDSLTVKNLLQFVGFDKVRLQEGRVIKDHQEIYFDFNAIAKGLLVDMIGRHFEDVGIVNYLVEIGGEIRARGTNQLGKTWKIAIENPNYDGTRSFATTIELNNKSIATSGNYRKFRTSDDGKKYVHTINTKTGYATESNLLSASVIGQLDCADLDAYATAFMAMGFEKSMQFVEKRGDLEVFLIYADKDGALKTWQFPPYKD
jgi:thiamine biosynthesis lipoprotein